MSNPDPAKVAEELGAKAFKSSVSIPIDCNLTDEQLTELGFEVGKRIDSVLRAAVFPIGWVIKSEDTDPRHMVVRDEKGAARARIFLKTVRYDYRGSIRFSRETESPP